MSNSVRPHQAPLSMEFSRQESWSRVPCPPPGDLPTPGIEPRSPALNVDSSPSEPPGSPKEPVASPPGNCSLPCIRDTPHDRNKDGKSHLKLISHHSWWPHIVIYFCHLFVFVMSLSSHISQLLNSILYHYLCFSISSSLGHPVSYWCHLHLAIPGINWYSRNSYELIMSWSFS